MVEPGGEVIRSWIGFEKVGPFLEDLSAAVADPVSMDSRLARFDAAPSEDDAAVLAEYRESRMEMEQAMGLYQRARELSADPSRGYEMQIFQASVYASRDGSVSLAVVRENADAVLEAPNMPLAELVAVGINMGWVASMSDQPELARPYIEAGIEAIENAPSIAEEDLADVRRLEIAHALLVENDVEKAGALKRETMPEGWERDPAELNAFAWWCFEHECLLGEAEELAARGADLSDDGVGKANILDTLAEIRFLRGDGDGAMKAIGEALELDPGNEYYRKQAVKFAGAGK